MSLVTADWNPMGDMFYRREELYCMAWADRFEVTGHLVAAAQHGGPVALMKDDQEKLSVRPTVTIYSCSGSILSSFKWKSGRVLALGWSHREELMVVQEDGQVLVYDQHGTFIRTFTMGNDVKSLRAVSACVFVSPSGTGLALLTGGVSRFVLADNTDSLRLQRLPETPGVLPRPGCWAVLSVPAGPVSVPAGPVSVPAGPVSVLATTGRELLLVQPGESRSVAPAGLSLASCSVVLLAVSPGRSLAALHTDSGLVWLGTSDLQTKLGEFDTRNPTPPRQLMWCGNPGQGSPVVVVVWDDVIMLTSNNNHHEPIRFPVDSPSLVVQEVDGIRILTKFSHDFVYRLSEASVKVFRIGSMEPGALLLEASREYESDSQKADEYLRAIREQGSLEEAVDQCIAAACNHRQTRTQKTLLRAAAFGKCFVSAGCCGLAPRGRPEDFVEACRVLRLLNSVRDPAVAMPLTYTQLEHLTIPVLIDRLVARRMFALAVKICELLRLPEPQGRSRVLAHWACYKVESDVPDEALALLMNSRLGDAPGLSYAEIAARATRLGRSDLAIKLLDFEPRAAEQVPLLMKLNRVDLAMMRAVQSGDSDLVYMVISHLKESVTRREFFLTLRQYPAAHSLYLKCCRQLQLETLKDLYEQDDEHEELGRVHVIDGHRHPRMDQRISSLNEAVIEFTRAKNDFATRMTEDQIRLLRVQVKLQEQLSGTTGGTATTTGTTGTGTTTGTTATTGTTTGTTTAVSLVGLSAHDTVLQLLRHRGLGRLADTTAKELRLPERRLWWIKVQVLAQRAEWVELQKLSKIKKSPIGYQPFVSECLKHGNFMEARKYIPRLSPEMRVKAYLSAGDMPGAVASAMERRCDDDVAAVLGHPMAASHRRLVETLRGGGGGGGAVQ